jgi:hypothetical protein
VVPALNGYCSAHRSDAYTGDSVTWRAQGVSGGNGNYTYSWSGTNGLSGSGSSVSKTYRSDGIKNATVTIRSAGKTITRECSTYINERYVPPVITYVTPTYTQPTYPVYQTDYQPVYPTYQTGFNGVSLSQVPYTGLSSNMKMILFILAVAVWSAIVTYVLILRKRNALVPATADISGSIVPEAHDSYDIEQNVRQESLMSYDNMQNHLEGFARNQNAIVSSDAMSSIMEHSGNDHKRAEALLSSLVNRHANSEGWTTIDFAKVQSALG